MAVRSINSKVRPVDGEIGRFWVASSDPSKGDYLLDFTEDRMGICGCSGFMRIAQNRENKEGKCYCTHIRQWAIYHVKTHHRIDTPPLPNLLKNAAIVGDVEFVVEVVWNLIDLASMRKCLEADKKKEAKGKKK